MGIVDLQCRNHRRLLSDFSCVFQLILTTFQYLDAKMLDIPKVDELEVSWVDNICELIHKNCH